MDVKILFQLLFNKHIMLRDIIRNIVAYKALNFISLRKSLCHSDAVTSVILRTKYILQIITHLTSHNAKKPYLSIRVVQSGIESYFVCNAMTSESWRTGLTNKEEFEIRLIPLQAADLKAITKYMMIVLNT